MAQHSSISNSEIAKGTTYVVGTGNILQVDTYTL
ncbi:hypothetical protein L1278_001641 [Pontibacter sp. HSC-36F09]|nr:hypothetical protein [Pontibacter sp. HSC-36F09]